MSDILQKVVDTTNVGSANGGLLNTEQANRFIDYMFDATILARAARTVRMRSNTADIDKVGVGTRLMTVATEATQTGANAAVTFSKISLTTKKLRLDWELSSEALEDNIEGADLEDHIARLMATQAGNDIEDLLINGVGTGTGLMSAFAGFRALALGSANVVNAGGANISKAVFNNAIKAMPRKYKQRRNELRFFTGSNLHGDIHLTFANNFVVGVKREIQVYREFKPKKDTIEYTMFVRTGCAIENPEAFVVVKNVKVSA